MSLYPLYPEPTNAQLPPPVPRPPRPTDASRPYIAEGSKKRAFENHCASIEALTKMQSRTTAPLNEGKWSDGWKQCYSPGNDENFVEGGRRSTPGVAKLVDIASDDKYMDAKDEEDFIKGQFDLSEGVDSPKGSVADNSLLAWVQNRLTDDMIAAYCEWAMQHEKGINRLLMNCCTAKHRKLYSLSQDNRRLMKNWDWDCRKIGTSFLDSFTRNGIMYPHQNITAVFFVFLSKDNEYIPDETGYVDLSEARAALRSKHLVNSADIGTVIYAILVGEKEILQPGNLPPTYTGMSQNAWRRFQEHLGTPVNHRMRALFETRSSLDFKMHILIRLPSDTPVSIQHLLEHYLMAYHDTTNATKQGININSLDWLAWATLIVGSTLLRIINALDLTLAIYPEQRIPLSQDVEAWRASVHPHLPSDMTEFPRSIGDMIMGNHRQYVWRSANKQHVLASAARELKTVGVNNVGEYVASDRFMSGRPRSDAWIESHPGEFCELSGGPHCSKTALALFIRRLAEGFAPLDGSDT